MKSMCSHNDCMSSHSALIPGSSSATVAFQYAPAGLAAPTSPPAIDSNGVLYLGDNNGVVHAVLTDTNASPPAASGADWPQIAHDNCNSNNASFTCQ